MVTLPSTRHVLCVMRRHGRRDRVVVFFFFSLAISSCELQVGHRGASRVVRQSPDRFVAFPRSLALMSTRGRGNDHDVEVQPLFPLVLPQPERHGRERGPFGIFSGVAAETHMRRAAEEHDEDQGLSCLIEAGGSIVDRPLLESRAQPLHPAAALH